jgi:hypothetical protein
MAGRKGLLELRRLEPVECGEMVEGLDEEG